MEESGLKSEKYKYVIIGGGTAGHAALVAILQNDPDAKVLFIVLSLLVLVYNSRKGVGACWRTLCTLFTPSSLERFVE